MSYFEAVVITFAAVYIVCVVINTFNIWLETKRGSK